jgi:hypothetical protein
MLRVVILGLSLELLLSSLDRVRRIWGAITSEPPQSMAGGLNHFERKWNPSSLLDMKNFAPVLLVLSVLSTMAVPQNARFVSSGNRLSEAYRTILYVPPKSPTQDFLAVFRPGTVSDRALN